jgi:hypothetical protein
MNKKDVKIEKYRQRGYKMLLLLKMRFKVFWINLQKNDCTRIILPSLSPEWNAAPFFSTALTARQNRKKLVR